MSRDVKFNIKLSIDGKEHIVTASTNVKKLATEFNNAYKESNKVKDSLLRFSQISSAFNNVMGGLQQLTGIMHEYTEASAVQEQAEVKLETVMRQRMNATDESIESIKKLASAQQELGIIGDEVQIEGAQQMATFLNEKSSIEVLLPAMNNLLAQQKGYNATGQDAVTIGNLIGKVMQGQTSALKRVGITFTEAEEKILKYGNESQRAATLAQVITNNVGNMNAALAQTETGKAKQLSNTIGDLKEEVGALFARLEPTIVAVGEFGLAFSAVASVASGLKAVWVGITGFTGAMSLAKIQVIAFTVCQKAQSVATAICTAVTNAARNAQIAYATGAGISTVATYALRAALISLMAATGVGLVIAGISMAIGALINNSDEATESLKKLEQQKNNVTQASQQEAALLNQTRAAYELNIQKLKNFHGTKEQEKKIVEEMNNTYGQTMGYFSSVNEWYNALIKNSKAYTEQMIAEAQARQIANQIAENEQKKYELIYNQDGSKKRYSLKRERQLIIGKGLFHPTIEGVREVKGSSEFEKAEARIKALNKRNKALKGRLQRIIAKQPKMVVKGASTAPQGTINNPPKHKATTPPKHKATTPPKHKATTPHPPKNTTPADSKDPVLTYKEKASTIKEMRDNIAIYEKKQEKATETEIADINRTIKKWRDKIAVMQEIGTEKVEENPSMERNQNAKTLDEYEDNLKKVHELQGKASIDEIAALNKEEKLWQDKIALMREAGMQQPEPKVNVSANNFKDIRANIEILQKQMDTAEAKERKNLSRQIKMWQKKADVMQRAADIDTFSAIKDGWGNISGIAEGIDSITNALDGNKNAWQAISGVVNGVIQVFQGIQGVITLLQVLGIVTDATAVSQTAVATATTATTAAQASSVAAGETQVAAEATQVVANKVLAASLVELASAQFFAAHASIPFVGAGLAAGFSATARTVVATMGIPFAKGGVISGPTLALVGEYAGASNNPEVIAPLDKLRSMIKPQGGIGGNVQFKISGRQLVGVIANETRISSKSGRRTNINI